MLIDMSPEHLGNAGPPIREHRICLIATVLMLRYGGLTPDEAVELAANMVNRAQTLARVKP